MSYNPEIHKRRSIRLKGHDYSQAGLYFITICLQNRECLFGNIDNGEMTLNDAGKMIETEWMNLKYRFPHIELHEYVVMPNHFHGIVEIVGATLVVAQNETENPVGATLVVANDGDTENEKGQPQGIAPTNKTNGIAETVGATLVVANDGDTKNEKGQPQGIAPTNKTNGIAETVGTTLVVAHDGDTENEKGQPQGIAPTNKTNGIAETVGATLVVAQNDDDIVEKGQPQGIATTNKTIGDMMDAFKSITTVEYIRGVKNLGWQPFNGKLWQRNYYEHIIRNQQSYETIANYIINNPAQWQEDKFHAQ